ERFSEDHRMLNVQQLQTRIDSLDLYISKKRSNLYRYFEPYFYRAADTIDIAENDVEARIAYLISKENEFKKKDSSKRELQSRKTAVVQLKKSTESEVQPKAVTKLAVIEKAIQSSNNVKRISSNSVDDSKSQKELKSKYQVEWHRKYTLAISCILLFFIGAPLGAIIKKGGFGLPLVISLLLFILYYVLNIFGEKLAAEGTLPSFLGMWLSTFLFFPLAIFLTYKASTDSKLFDADSYLRILRKFKKA
ncbi:MAG: LptF/LptG family permease, partial [Bacteroidia bacterium]|nr:LptF/LptG family permease [Bacteroidia bacterium]